MAEIANNLANVIALNNDAQNYNTARRNPIAADNFRNDYYHESNINTETARNSERITQKKSDQLDAGSREDFKKVLEKRLSQHQDDESNSENSKKDQKVKDKAINQNDPPVYFFDKPHTKESMISEIAQKAGKNLPKKENSNIPQKNTKETTDTNAENIIKTGIKDKSDLTRKTLSAENASEPNQKDSVIKTKESLITNNKTDKDTSASDKKSNTEQITANTKHNNDKIAEIATQKLINDTRTDDSKTNSTKQNTLKDDIVANITKQSSLNSVNSDDKQQNKKLDVKLDNNNQDKPEKKIDTGTDTKKEKLKRSLDEFKTENIQEKIQSEHLVSESKISNTQVPENNVSNPNSQTPGISARESISTVSAASQIQRPAAQIIENIQALINGPEREISMTLNPAELGRVRIRFVQEQGQVSGMLEIEKPQTRNEVERQLPQIVAAIQGSGVQVRKIEVVQQQQQQAQDNQSSQEEIPYKFNPDSDHSDSRDDAQKKQNSPRSNKQEINDFIPSRENKTAAQTLSDDNINVYL